MRDAIVRIQSHFHAHRQRAKWPFFWRITLEGGAVSLLCVALLSCIISAGGRPSLEKLSPSKLIVVTVLVAPILETFFLQTVPVAIARALGARFWIQVLASLVPFAALHFPAGIGTGVGAGLVGGFYIAFTYVRWREESFSAAFTMTAGTHALRNALAVAVIVGVKAVFSANEKPNKGPEPTSGTVTNRADARSAPVAPVAHL